MRLLALLYLFIFSDLSFAKSFYFKDFKKKSITESSNNYLKGFWGRGHSSKRYFYAQASYEIPVNLIEIDTRSLIDKENLSYVIGAKSLSQIERDKYRISLSAYTLTFWTDLSVYFYRTEDVENSKFKSFYSTYCSVRECSSNDEILVFEFSNFNKALSDIVVYVHIQDVDEKSKIEIISIISANKKWWKRRNPFGFGTKLLKGIVQDIISNSHSVLRNSL